jgi:tRNA G26 N,N-dimethylase Trm1
MSVRVLARVWDGYPGGGSELLTLLALADWSDDDGHCFPSIQKIAEKVRLKERQAQRVVHSLIADGFVLVTETRLAGLLVQAGVIA